MAIENREEAFREGTAVRMTAESLMEKTGAKGKPTRDAYDIASGMIEMSQVASRENAELVIDSLNIQAEIEGAIGETKARRLGSIQERILDAHGQEIAGFLNGEREIEDVLNILEEALEEDEVGGGMVKEHPGLKQLLAEDREVTLKLVKAGMR